MKVEMINGVITATAENLEDAKKLMRLNPNAEYKCPTCGKPCLDKKGLSVHMTKSHPKKSILKEVIDRRPLI